jgi:hypothetical protein
LNKITLNEHYNESFFEIQTGSLVIVSSVPSYRYFFPFAAEILREKFIFSESLKKKSENLFFEAYREKGDLICFSTKWNLLSAIDEEFEFYSSAIKNIIVRLNKKTRIIIFDQQTNVVMQKNHFSLVAQRHFSHLFSNLSSSLSIQDYSSKKIFAALNAISLCNYILVSKKNQASWWAAFLSQNSVIIAQKYENNLPNWIVV